MTAPAGDAPAPGDDGDDGDEGRYRRFVLAETRVGAPALVPELALHLAEAATPLWEATEATLSKTGLPPPYWAFAWPGGQATARHLLDHPELVAGRTVLDFGAGSGIAGIAAAKAGAARVVLSDIDPFAGAAMRLNAGLNDVEVEVTTADLVGSREGFDLVLAGDVCYERPMAEAVTRWLAALAVAGVPVILADPGRSYLPSEGLEALATYAVPTSLDLEDREVRETTLYRLVG